MEWQGDHLTLDVGVDYDEDPAHVKGVLLEVLEKSLVLDDPAPRVHLWELADSSVIFRLFGYLGDYADEQLARDYILQEVHHRFGIEGISIPFNEHRTEGEAIAIHGRGD